MGVLCVVHGLCGVMSTGCGVVWWVAVPCGLCGWWVFFVRCVVNVCALCCTWTVWCVEHWVWCGGWLYHVDCVVGGCSS